MPEDNEPQAHWVHGIGIAGYRSFGGAQKFGPLGKLNLIIGQNNAGKSNLLRFLHQHYGNLVEKIRRKQACSGFGEIDRNRDLPDAKLQLWLALPTQERFLPHLKKYLRERIGGHPDAIRAALDLLTSDSLKQNTAVSWFAFESSWDSKIEPATTFVTEVLKNSPLSPDDWRLIWMCLTGKNGGDATNHWVPEALFELAFLLGAPGMVPEVIFIPAIRQVMASDKKDDWDWGGRGLILRLAELRDPGHTPKEQTSKKRFESVNRFLRLVTGSPSATLEIPHTRDTLYVRMNERTLPLEALGTGIHEVVIIAAAAATHSKKVVCIEEPEIHLHPILQRKLLRYLENETDNQYFFATHSAHLLQHPDAAIFHVRLKNGRSKVKNVDSAYDKSEICVDLGYRASDIIQANCVIWVEGPTDRLYLRHWIEAVAPDLVEGLHYSIMFYGGRLLNHLSAHDPEVADFISLRRLNRFIGVVMDSDREKPKQRLNKTKLRVRKEFEEDPDRGFAWATQGREIENYIPAEMLEGAIRKVHPKAQQIAKPEQYQRPLQYRTSKRSDWQTADKVKVAREVIQKPADLDQLDLRKQVSKVVGFIRGANES